MEATRKNGTGDKQKTRRQLVDEAKHAALEGDWAGALRVNTDLIERFSPDAEMYNRRGRAFSQHARYGDAFEAYQEALRIDPANMIARRNLQRLETLRSRPTPEQEENGSQSTVTIPKPHVFIEEVGKTWSGELVNPTDMDTLSETSSGQQLDIVVDEQRLYATTADGTRLGEFETDTARRVIALMEGGNRYEIYALGVSKSSLRVILREVYRDPDQATRVSFPGKIKATRAYLRERDMLLQRDEADFLDLSDDENSDDDDTVTDAAEEREPADEDAASYVPAAARSTEDEELIV